MCAVMMLVDWVSDPILSQSSKQMTFARYFCNTLFQFDNQLKRPKSRHL